MIPRREGGGGLVAVLLVAAGFEDDRQNDNERRDREETENGFQRSKAKHPTIIASAGRLNIDRAAPCPPLGRACNSASQKPRRSASVDETEARCRGLLQRRFRSSNPVTST
jgi:hypothetical protein